MSYIPKPDAWAARLDNTRSQSNQPQFGTAGPAVRGTGRSHRRHNSIVFLSSDDVNSAPKAPFAFIEAGTVQQEADFGQQRAPSDARPTSVWRKLELPKLQLIWPMDASKRRSTVSVVPQLETRLWTPEETNLLAHASLRFWMGGRTADLGPVARELRRSVRDVQTMLQLMLQEYVLQAQKTHWLDHEESVIRQWAATEFPKCSTLNAAGAARRTPVRLVSTSNCFSLLRCRPLSGYKPIVAETPDQSVPVVAVDDSERSEPTKQGNGNDRGGIVLTSGPPSRRDPESGASKPLFSLTAPPPIQDVAHSKSKADTAEPTSANSGFAATVTSRKGVNVLSKNTRSRRGGEVRIRRANAPAPATISSIAPSSSHTKPMAYSRDDPPTTYDMNDTELSPEQSSDTHDFNRLDGDIDLRFFDVPAAARKAIRVFVDGYIERYFDVFFYRAAQISFDGRRLCATLGESTVGDNAAFTDLELVNAIEREMLCFESDLLCSSDDKAALAPTGISLDRFSLHFRASLLRAVQQVNIYASDANWPSADAYATAVYNRAIEDVHYLALEGRIGAVERKAAPGPAAAQRSWFKSLGLRMNQFKRHYYMGVVASRLAGKYIKGPGQHVFLKRVGLFGYRAVPTAINYDDSLGEEEMARELEDPTTDVSVRCELHSLIMDMIPHATNNSTMIAMQRSVEVYNKIAVEYVESRRGELAKAFEGSVTPGIQPIDPSVVEAIKRANGAMTTDLACAVARWISEQWFDQLKAGTLKALVVDHPFRPLTLSDVRRWIFEDRSPTGNSTEYLLNVALYQYLKAQRVKMNETKWLYASAAATLRLIELVKVHVQNSHLLAHVGLSEYAALFNELIAAESPPAPRHRRAGAPEMVELPLLSRARPETLEDAAATPSEQLAGSSPDWSWLGHVGQEQHVSRLHLEELAWRASSSGLAPLQSLPAKDFGAYGQYKPQADAPRGMRFGYHDYSSVNISPLTEQSTPTGLSETAALGSVAPAKAATEPTAEARLEVLEKEVANMRREIGDVVKLQRNVSEILGLLRGREPIL
ncbi:hypothetical protein GGI20_004134 [Coemansia sp. BCRC 34301]|nr:hypothetical protein GGI20_004134 [Coemansia sp. BCRC 34301]